MRATVIEREPIAGGSSAASRRRSRWPLLAACAGCAVSVTGLILRALPVGTPWWIAGTAFSRYLLAAAPAGALIAVMSRRWAMAGVAAALTVAGVVVALPAYIADSPPTKAVSVSVMTANLRLGSADPVALVNAVRQRDVDVLTVQELTSEEVARLDRAGLGALLPHRELAAAPDAFGVGIYSRYPIAALPLPKAPPLTFRVVSGQIRVPGTASVTVAAVHPAGPWPGPSDDWRADMNRLPALLRTLIGNSPGSVLVGGDFNATTDSPQFRRLLTDGFADATGQAGAGTIHTYPAGQWYPPLIGIDHVLVRGAVGTRAVGVDVPGSDHRALLVQLAVPTDPDREDDR